MPENTDEYKKEFELFYGVARKKFAKQHFISTGKLQASLQIPYNIAREILDRLIDEKYCEKQIAAYPCRIFHFKTN